MDIWNYIVCCVQVCFPNNNFKVLITIIIYQDQIGIIISPVHIAFDKVLLHEINRCPVLRGDINFTHYR